MPRLLRSSRPLLALFAAMALATLAIGVRAESVEAAPLDCSGTAGNVVGAHAGSLSIRVGLDLECDEPAALQVTLPGGGVGEFETDAGGTFTGVVGNAYVCQGEPAPLGILATSEGGDEWIGTLEIGPGESAPPDTDELARGADCDVLLHPDFNYVTYAGAAATPELAFAGEQFNGVMPFGDNTSTEPEGHVLAVFEFGSQDSVTEFEWREWRPGAPEFVNDLDLLVPGHSYAVLTDAEMAWVFPAEPEA